MKRLLTKCALLLALCAALALPALADSVTDTISVCIGYFGWTEDEYVEKAKFSWQELDDWYGGALDTHEEFYSYSNGGGRTYLVYARGFYIRDLLDYAGVDVNSIASIDFFTKDHSNGAYRSFTKYALLDQPRYYFPNLAADPETGELYAWDGGDDLWVGAYQVEPMLALEDYTEWDTSGFDFESYVDESLFSTGNRFHLFFGQQSPEEAATSSAAKYVYKILVTFSGTPVLSSEEQNLDLIVGSDHALHVTADAEDDALTDYVQQNLQYVSSDPSVVSVDQYGRLHVNAEGDAVITASFGQSSVSVNVHIGSGGASGTGSTSGTGTEPGGEAASGTLDLPKPEEAEAVPVTEPVDARSVYILSGGAVSTGENGTTAGEGMQDGSVQLVLPEKAAQKTWPVYAALALSVLPFEARAASDAWDGTVDISWYDPAKTEYEIDTPAKLAGLAALVNGMADPTAKKIVGNTAYLVSKKVDNVMLVGAGGGNVFDTVYTGGIDFDYKTVYLTADLDMGGRKGASGSWTGPNWTPIGGKFPMKPAEAAGDCMTLDTRFNGILDGQGHTIYNLYCNRYAAKGFPYSMAVGVVGFLGGNADYANGVSGERSEAEFETG